MKAKKLLICIIAIVLLCSLVACESSSYVAIGLVRVTKDNYCMSSFHKLDGQLVFTPRYTLRDEGRIHFVASLEEGEVNVYYDCAGVESVKELLFNVKAGEEIDSYGGYIEKGRQRIYIETVSPSKGKITIEFE